MTAAIYSTPRRAHGTADRRISATIAGKEYLFLITRLPSGEHRRPIATEKLGRSSWLVRL
jgi:hypothetical protein